MKKILILILGVAFFIACDKVKNPNQTTPTITCVMPVTPALIGNNFVTKTNTAKSGFRKILIEDYTGHRCGNCPGAAVKLEALELQYKDSVVGMAVHAGTQFAPPLPPEYLDDFRTQTGTDWDTYFGLSGAGLPKGMINRNQPYPKAWPSWSSFVVTNLYKPQTVKLDITSNLDTAGLKLNVDVKSTFISAKPNKTMLSVAFTEDSIKGHQTNYVGSAIKCLKGGDEDTCYVFNNLLRGAINGTWGEEVKDDCDVKFYRGVAINPGYKIKNLFIVVFLYDDATKEILQVEKMKLK